MVVHNALMKIQWPESYCQLQYVTFACLSELIIEVSRYVSCLVRHLIVQLKGSRAPHQLTHYPLQVVQTLYKCTLASIYLQKLYCL